MSISKKDFIPNSYDLPKLIKAFLILLALIFSVQIANGASLDKIGKVNKRSPVAIFEVKKTEKGVVILFEEALLGEALAQVQAKSGIRIQLPDRLRNELIEAHIVAPNWSTAVRHLLSPFSTLEVGGEEMIRVNVLDRKDDTLDFKNALPTVRLLGNTPHDAKARWDRIRALQAEKKIWAKANIKLSIDQLRRVGGPNEIGPFPEELLKDPAYRDLFARNGISTPEDMKQSSKTFSVRKEARKMLRVLEKRAFMKNLGYQTPERE